MCAEKGIPNEVACGPMAGATAPATFPGVLIIANAELLSHIVNDSQKIFPLSCPLSGEYGIKNISIGVPAKIGRTGIQKIYEIPLKSTEYKKLLSSSEKLKKLFLECSL